MAIRYKETMYCNLGLGEGTKGRQTWRGPLPRLESRPPCKGVAPLPAGVPQLELACCCWASRKQLLESPVGHRQSGTGSSGVQRVNAQEEPSTQASRERKGARVGRRDLRCLCPCPESGRKVIIRPGRVLTEQISIPKISHTTTRAHCTRGILPSTTSLYFAILRMLSIAIPVKKRLKGMLSIWEGEPAAKRLGTDNWNSRRLILARSFCTKECL